MDSNGCAGNDADTVDLYISIADRGSVTFSIYPNPTDAMLYIKSGIVTVQLDIRITNGLGQVVHEGYFPGTSQIDLSGYASGLYCVLVVYEGVVVRREKLILR